MEKVVPIDEEYEYEGKIAICQTDLEGNITYVNKKFCEISGYEASELIGQNINILKHEKMPELVQEKVWKTIQDGQSWHGLYINLRKDGRYYWVDTEITQVKDDDGNIIGYISVGKPASPQDIQETKEQYEKMLDVQW
ncbi:Methyl-accepting chemotaxis protein [hydrothermal vent metagenome]|uniref:Methyl-accepting chemotaxis protein n=1 Tax=hydrothermal vent metagenome TaxID=652676 RepID=A0A1W1D1H3_9ZZZZ